MDADAESYGRTCGDYAETIMRHITVGCVLRT